MKVIIDPYRGGNDLGENINGNYEKDLLLELSMMFSDELNKLGIENILIRDDDISISDNDRNDIINKIKNDDDIIIQNRYLSGDGIEIIYPLRSNDRLVSFISNDLLGQGILVKKYYQRRLPSDTIKDYYSIIRNTSPNETLIIGYNDFNNYQKVVKVIANSLSNYLNEDNIYIVKSGDTLYQIAKKNNVSVDDIKKINNLNNNLLNIGQKLIIPEKKKVLSYLDYVVKKGDNLYQISKKYGINVNELKKINNLSSNILNIGQILKVPGVDDEYKEYVVVKGDSLYQIAKKNNISVDEIKKINNLNNNLLSIGQILKLPK